MIYIDTILGEKVLIAWEENDLAYIEVKCLITYILKECCFMANGIKGEVYRHCNWLFELSLFKNYSRRRQFISMTVRI